MWALAEDEEGEDPTQLPPGWLQGSPAGDEEGEESDAPMSPPSSAPAPSSLIDVLCRKAQGACRAKFGPRIRSMLMAAYAEDPIGTAAMAKALLQSNPDLPTAKKQRGLELKRRRKAKVERKATLRKATELVVAACALDATVTGGGGGLDDSQPRNGGHPKSQSGKYITSSEGIEICFTFAKNARGACPDPCRNKRAHLCQICLGLHRNEKCDRSNNLGKGGKGERGK